MLLQSSPPAFPVDRSNRGKPGQPSPPRSQFRAWGLSWWTRSITFQGPDPKDAQAVAGRHGSAGSSLEPAESVTAKIRKQEGKGSLTFDAEIRPHRQQPQQSEDGNDHHRSRPGHRSIQRYDIDDDARALDIASVAFDIRSRSVVELQTIPCFFTLLKNVLRGIPSSRAATLLFPLASLRASMSRWRS